MEEGVYCVACQRMASSNEPLDFANAYSNTSNAKRRNSGGTFGVGQGKQKLSGVTETDGEYWHATCRQLMRDWELTVAKTAPDTNDQFSSTAMQSGDGESPKEKFVPSFPQLQGRMFEQRLRELLRHVTSALVSVEQKVYAGADAYQHTDLSCWTRVNEEVCECLQQLFLLSINAEKVLNSYGDTLQITGSISATEHLSNVIAVVQSTVSLGDRELLQQHTAVLCAAARSTLRHILDMLCRLEFNFGAEDKVQALLAQLAQVPASVSPELMTLTKSLPPTPSVSLPPPSLNDIAQETPASRESSPVKLASSGAVSSKRPSWWKRFKCSIRAKLARKDSLTRPSTLEPRSRNAVSKQSGGVEIASDVPEINVQAAAETTKLESESTKSLRVPHNRWTLWLGDLNVFPIKSHNQRLTDSTNLSNEASGTGCISTGAASLKAQSYLPSLDESIHQLPSGTILTKEQSSDSSLLQDKSDSKELLRIDSGIGGDSNSCPVSPDHYSDSQQLFGGTTPCEYEVHSVASQPNSDLLNLESLEKVVDHSDTFESDLFHAFDKVRPVTLAFNTASPSVFGKLTSFEPPTLPNNRLWNVQDWKDVAKVLEKWCGIKTIGQLTNEEAPYAVQLKAAEQLHLAISMERDGLKDNLPSDRDRYLLHILSRNISLTTVLPILARRILQED